MKPSAAWLFGRIWSRRLGVHVRRSSRQPRDRRAPPCRARPLSCGPLEHLPTDFFRLYKPTYPKNIEYQDRSGVPPPQASVATKNQFVTLFQQPVGGRSHHWRPYSSSRRYPWRGGSSSPSGLRVCTSSYVFDLSLSRVLSRVPSMAQSWCIPSFAIIVGSYDVSPPLLSCDELSFPFEVILSDWVFYENTWCMSCLDYLWWQWDIMCHLMYVLVIKLRVSWHWEPMHRGWHTFFTLR